VFPLFEFKNKRAALFNLIATSLSSISFELCCGNAQLLGPLASRCRKATGVDYSEALLKKAQKYFPNTIDLIKGDALTIKLVEGYADVILIYFAIQHFDEKSAIRLISKAAKYLKPGGRLFVGDIPDNRKLWQYLSKAEYRKDYIKRVLENRPMIGTWFDREFFEAIGDYLKNVDVKIIEQPDWQINSGMRFDVLYIKHTD
jgi:ubiquinone/menaquinone biosynthesis C-methylase UbiE